MDSLINLHDTAPIVPTRALCNDFLNFFVDKISALLPAPSPAAPDPSDPPMCPAVFDQFDSTSLSSLSDVVH